MTNKRIYKWREWDRGSSIVIWWYKNTSPRRLLSKEYHREDGPFGKDKNGSEYYWWYHGKKLKFLDWLDHVELTDEEKALLILEYA